jgi:hypothetical protein
VNLPTRFLIRAIKDEPPTLEVVHPGIDTLVHPMEEIAFAARAQDTIGLKEVRLHSFFNLEKEAIQQIDCIEAGQPASDKLAEFVIDLEPRANIQKGDTILFHFEAEDTKGQVAASEVYAITVRPWESVSAYGYHPVMGAHGYAGPELINIIGAAWDLYTRRHTMPQDEFSREAEKIGRALEAPNP